MSKTYCDFEEVQRLLNMLKEKSNPKNWEKFLSYVNKFFGKYMTSSEQCNRGLLAITEIEVDDFIEKLPVSLATKANYYQALGAFFDFALIDGSVTAFFSRVKKYVQPKTTIKYVEDEDYEKLKIFINSSEPIVDRLVIALFLYSGLSRRYVANLSFSQISETFDQFYFENVNLPIKKELSTLLSLYYKDLNFDRGRRLFHFSDETLSTLVGKISKRACGCKYTSTILCNTFIKKSLGKDSQWKNLYIVSKLTLESVQTIEKHLMSCPDWLVDEQRKILKLWE